GHHRGQPGDGSHGVHRQARRQRTLRPAGGHRAERAASRALFPYPAAFPHPAAVTIVGSPIIGPTGASGTAGNGCPHLARSGTPAGPSPHAPSTAATPSRPAPSRPERAPPAPSGSAWEAVTRNARSVAAQPEP